MPLRKWFDPLVRMWRAAWGQSAPVKSSRRKRESYKLECLSLEERQTIGTDVSLSGLMLAAAGGGAAALLYNLAARAGVGQPSSSDVVLVNRPGLEMPTANSAPLCPDPQVVSTVRLNVGPSQAPTAVHLLSDNQDADRWTDEPEASKGMGGAVAGGPDKSLGGGGDGASDGMTSSGGGGDASGSGFGHDGNSAQDAGSPADQGGSQNQGNQGAVPGSPPGSTGAPSLPAGNAGTPGLPQPTLPGAGNPGIPGVALPGIGTGGVATGSPGQLNSAPGTEPTSQTFANLPVRFEQNVGQVGDNQTQFIVRGSDGGTMMLGPTQATLIAGSGSGDSVQMQFVGANASASAVAQDQLVTKTNYLFGGDTSQWITGVSNFAQVTYQDLYQGVDLRYFSTQQNQLEYDFIVHPGASTDSIKLSFQGADKLSLDAQGNLVVSTKDGDIVHQAPQIYQDINGFREQVAGNFVIDGNQVGFQIGSYDKSQALVIDPILGFSGYLGGSANDHALGIAVDGAGNSYVTGWTDSTNVPLVNQYQSNQPSRDAFVEKINADGTQLLFSTYIGGSSSDEGHAIAVDSAGNTWITGQTDSTNFPTQNPYQTNQGSRDVFLTKLSASGSSVIFSTYLGGASQDVGNAVAVDSADNVYAAGYTNSTDFATLNPYQTDQSQRDGWIWKFSSSGAAQFGTYFGGNSVDEINGIAVGPNDNLFVVGDTTSSNLPTTPGAFKTTRPGSTDAFITKFSTDGSQLVYSSYLGGSGDQDVAMGVAVDADNQAYVTGWTQSSNFPTQNPYQSTRSGTQDAFLTKFNAAGSGLVYSTFLGGTASEQANGVAVDAAGRAYVTGFTTSTNYPTTSSPIQTNQPGDDAFATQFKADGSGLLYSTYLGGDTFDQGQAIALDAFSNAYIAGWSDSPNFPTAGPLQTTAKGEDDGFIARIINLKSLAPADDPQQADLLPTGDGFTFFSAQTGDVITSNPILCACGCVQCQTGSDTVLADSALSYNSGTVNPQPIIVTNVPTRSGDPVPSKITVTLTWDGVAQTPQDFTVPSGHSAGDIYQVSVVAPVSATGHHTWQIDVTYTITGPTVVTVGTTTGTSDVVNRTSSPYGPGWGLAGVDSIVPTTGGVLYVSGATGMARYFANPASGSTYVNPANEFGTLVNNGSSGFTYTDKNGVVSTFDSSGNIKTMKDTHNSVRTFNYTGGLLTGITMADGTLATFTYSSGLLSKVETGTGITTITRDGSNNTATIINPDGKTRTLVYTNSKLTSDTWGPLRSTYTYDSNAGKLTSVDRDAGDTLTVHPQAMQSVGSTAQNAVDDPGTVTDGLGRTTTYVLDSAGRILNQIAPDGTVRTWDRDSHGSVVQYRDELGRSTNYFYQYGTGKGDLTDIIRPDGSAVHFAYDSTFHNLVQYQDSLGRFTTYTLDATTGDVLTMRDALNHVTTYTYFLVGGVSTGLVHTITDPRNHTTTYNYDVADRHLDSVTDALNHTTSYTYDSAGNIQTVRDALNRVTTYSYDGMRRMVGIVDALNQRMTYAYDAISDLVSMSDQLGRVTSYNYDVRGLLMTTTEAVGTSVQRTSSMTYDAVGNMIATVDPRGVLTCFVYDSRDRQTQMIEAVGASVQRTTTVGYDSVSNILFTTDARGITTSFAYDSRDRQTSMIEAFGTPLQRTFTTAYDSESNVTSSTDPLGRVTKYAYDALNRTISMTEAFGTSVQRTTSMTYDANSNLVSQTDALGRVTSYVYDAVDRLSTMTAAVGTAVQRTMTYGYDAVNNLTSYTDALGRVTSYGYDSLNRQVSTTEAAGTSVQRTTTTGYDAVGNVTSTKDALARVTSYVYDALNRNVSMTEAVGTSVQRTMTMTYDAADNQTTYTDGLGHTTTYHYDALNRQTAYIDPLNLISTTVYDANDNVIRTINPRGFTTSYSYDVLNRLVTRTDALNHVATTSYDAADNVTATTDERGNTTSYTYDALNRQIARTDALNHTTSILYDAVNNVLATIDALGFPTSYAYDALNRQITMLTPSGGITSTIYDAVDNVLASIDPVGQTTSYLYDALNRNTQTIDALGGITTMLFDAVDNETGLIDPVGNQTTMVYDDLNREIDCIDPLNNSTTYSYNAAGLMTSITDRDGRQRDFAYDADNRLLTDSWFNSSIAAVNTLTYSYDQNGNLLTAGDSHGTYTMTYDALDRVATQQDIHNLGLSFSYDAVGNRVGVADSLGGFTTSVYDAANRLSSRRFNDGTTQLRIDFTYTARDQLATETRYSDLAGTALVGPSLYTYDAQGRTTDIVHEDNTSTPIASYTYTYDQADRLTSQVINGVTTTFAYDSKNELTADGANTFSYDPNYNQTGTGFTTGTDNRLLSDGTFNYSYDDEGNLTKKIRIADGDTWTYEYDNRNQLVHAEERVTDGGTLIQTEDFEYDVFGNRVAETVTTGTATTTQFAFDLGTGLSTGNIWADLDGSSSLTTRRIFGDSINEPLARITSTAVAWYLPDRQGSIRDLVDVSGAPQDHAEYDAFGNIVSESNASFGDRYKYVGMQWEQAVSLYYVNARNYDPFTHFFLSQDPLRFGGGYSQLYVYVGNNATNATDLTGLWDQKGVVAILKQTPTGRSTLDRIAKLEKDGKMKIFNSDLRYKKTNKPGPNEDDLAFNDPKAKGWKIASVYAYVLPNNEIRIDKTVGNMIAAITLVHEVKHTEQEPYKYENPKNKRERRLRIKEVFQAEYEAHEAEAKFLLEKPEWICKEVLGDEYEEYTTEFLKKGGNGKSGWRINKQGLKARVNKLYIENEKNAAKGEYAETGYAYQVNNDDTQIKNWPKGNK